MSPRKSNNPGNTEKPAPDAFVGLLFVAVAALIGGCVFLVMELSKYEWRIP